MANSWNGKLCCLCIVLVPLVFARPALTKPVYTTLPANTDVASINDSGVVVGVMGVPPYSGFIRTPDGVITTFAAAQNTLGTFPAGINGSGVMTGFYADNAVVIHGFVRDAGGTITAFDAPGASPNAGGTVPVGINAQGVITGYYADRSGNHHGFVRAVDGTITSIDVPGASQTQAFAINDNGEIVGGWNDHVEHGFLRSADGTITSFDAPGSSLGTEGDALNNKGFITGFYVDQNGHAHGYIRRPNGKFTTVDIGTGGDTYPAAINDRGTIAGRHDNALGAFRAFVRMPSGRVRPISPLNPNQGDYVSGINNEGVVAGDFQSRPDQNTPYTDYGYIWTP